MGAQQATEIGTERRISRGEKRNDQHGEYRGGEHRMAIYTVCIEGGVDAGRGRLLTGPANALWARFVAVGTTPSAARDGSPTYGATPDGGAGGRAGDWGRAGRHGT